MISIDEMLAASPVIPVIVLDRVADAVPLARSLVEGGVRVIEVTLRTSVALECVREICVSVPEAIVGVGTIISAEQIDAARGVGAAFGVSPGVTPEVLKHAKETALPFLPGTMTPSDVMHALNAGYSRMKFFPAGPAGGIPMLKALAGPFPEVSFCPTGGIDATNAPAYLALSNVCCVGGSWLAPPSRVAAGDWEAIRKLAEAAAGMRRLP